MRQIIQITSVGLVLCCAMMAPGCASQPITLATESQDDLEAQTRLRYTASALGMRVQTQGWATNAAAGDAAQAFFNRLMHGDDGRQTHDQPIQMYISAHADAPDDAVLEDLSEMIDLARAIAASAEDVAASERYIGREALGLDLAASENALSSIRRAHEFFHDVVAALNAGPDFEAQAGDALIELEGEKNRLVDATDALAERRWRLQSRRGLTG